MLKRRSVAASGSVVQSSGGGGGNIKWLFDGRIKKMWAMKDFECKAELYF